MQSDKWAMHDALMHCQQECAMRGAHPTPPHLRTNGILVGRTHEAKPRTADAGVRRRCDARQDQVKVQREQAEQAITVFDDAHTPFM